jgi:hypothetical protein
LAQGFGKTGQNLPDAFDDIALVIVVEVNHEARSSRLNGTRGGCDAALLL